MREVTLEDLDAIEIGAAILGTGGGGNPSIGKLRCREELRKGRKIPIIPLDELPDDALVVSLGGIGAPVVGVEKIEEGEECLRASRAVEQEAVSDTHLTLPTKRVVWCSGGGSALQSK